MSVLDKKDLERRMASAVKFFEDKLAGVHGGRPSPSLLDSIKVDAYGSATPLSQLGSVTVSDSQQLTVQVWDAGLIGAVEKAIRDSNLDLNPQSAGGVIRVNIPPPTEERRNQYITLVGKYAEEARVAVRGVRRSGLDQLKAEEKNGGVSKDDIRTESDNVQKMTDEHVATINTMLAKKETDLKTV